MKDKEELQGIAESARILRELLAEEWNGIDVIRAGENLLASISYSDVEDDELYSPNGAYLLLVGILSQLDDVDLSLHQDFYHKSKDEVDLWIRGVITSEISSLLEAARYFETKYGRRQIRSGPDVPVGIDNARTLVNHLFGVANLERGRDDSVIVLRFLQEFSDPERFACLKDELSLRSVKMTESHATKWLLIDCQCAYDYSFQGYTALEWIARLADLLGKGDEI